MSGDLLTEASLGVLDGTSMALRSDGFSEPSKKAERPVRLKLPEKFRNLRCLLSRLTATYVHVP